MEQERLWNRNYNRVMVTNFALFFSFYLLTPLLPLYLSETFGATKDTIGMVLSGYTLAALLVRPFSGFMVDRFKRRTVLLFFLILYFLLFFGYIVAGSILLFAILRTVHGGPFGASTVANSTVAIDVLPSSRRNEGIGYYGMSNNLGSAIAPTIGLWIYQETGDFDLLFLLALLVAGIGLVSAATVRIPDREIIRDTRPVSLDRFFLLRGTFMAINICFFGFCWGVLSNYLAIFGKEHLGITTGTGAYFMILSIGLIVSRLQGSKALREGKLLENAAVGIVLSMIGYFLFIGWPSTIGYYLSAVLIGLGNGHMWPAFQNMIIAIAAPSERGTANSTILTAWDLGLGLGILLGGVVAELLGYDWAFWMMVLAHFLGTSFFFISTRRRFIAQTRR